MTRNRFIEFDEFLSSIISAKASDLSARKEIRVSSETEFEKMKSHVLSLYKDVTVKHSFVNEWGQYVDCIPFEQQPSVRGTGLTLQEALNSCTPPPVPTLPDRKQGDSPVFVGPQIGLGQRDEFGNDIDCPDGCIPMLRIPLERLTRFETLSDFLAKPSSRGRQSPSARGVKQDTCDRIYATGQQTVDNYGAYSSIGLWNPMINATTENSISQIWVTGEDSNFKQAVEVGWQVEPYYFGTGEACLFVYYTPDEKAGIGCYNLMCGAFVQVAQKNVLGYPFSAYSQIGGTQQYLTVAVFRQDSTGNWNIWLPGAFFNSPETMVLLGYYPVSLFTVNGIAGQLTKNGTVVEFGGEMCKYSPPYGQMGSGLLADRGEGYAASHQDTRYFGMDFKSNHTQLTLNQTDPSGFTSDVDASFGKETLYFGGPGRLYLAYRGVDKDYHLYTAYYDGISWYGNEQIKIPNSKHPNPKSNHSPSAVIFQNNLYLIYKGASTKNLFMSYYDGSSWYGNEQIKIPNSKHPDPQSDLSPNIAANNTTLYAVYKGDSDYLYMSYYDGSVWYGNEQIKIPGTKHPNPQSTYSPSAVVYRDTLYMVYLVKGTTDLYMALYRNNQWVTNVQVRYSTSDAPKAYDAPCIFMYQGFVYLIYKASDASSSYDLAYFNVGKWSYVGALLDGSQSSPSAVAYNTILSLAFRTSSTDDELSTAYFDGSTVIDIQKIKDQPGGIDPKSKYSPHIIVY